MAKENPAITISDFKPSDLEDVRSLFREYEASLGFELCFQGFDAELAELPGKYAPPHGALLVARNSQGAAVGCVALRPLEPSPVCEMKRLYVRPAARGAGLGQSLVSAILARATELGYQEMKLDTVERLAAAIRLYQRNGFAETRPYNDAPLGDIRYFSKILTSRNEVAP